MASYSCLPSEKFLYACTCLFHNVHAECAEPVYHLGEHTSWDSFQLTGGEKINLFLQILYVTMCSQERIYYLLEQINLLDFLLPSPLSCGHSQVHQYSQEVKFCPCSVWILISTCIFTPFLCADSFLFSWITVLDGIGKGLDPRFDISEIAKP